VRQAVCVAAADPAPYCVTWALKGGPVPRTHPWPARMSWWQGLKAVLVSGLHVHAAVLLLLLEGAASLMTKHLCPERDL